MKCFYIQGLDGLSDDQGCCEPYAANYEISLSWQKLEVLLAENFELTDLVVSLTYRDECLPFTKAQAETRLNRFIRQLRASRRLRDDATLYVYCTEGRHGAHRLHHHIVLNATGVDYEEIRELWAVNGDNVDFATIADKGYDGWAQYLTKSPRREGSRVGERTWVPCMGLRRPVAVSENCSDECAGDLAQFLKTCPYRELGGEGK